MLNYKTIKKKRRDNINKKIFFLITLVSIMLFKIINVNAESATFYEAEYIDGIYMSKYQYSNNTIYYQKARFFRKSDTGEAAYCIEPFKFFNEYSTYESTINPYNLSWEQKTRIERIAHFGYGYKYHTDAKWYAITQMMIWETADPYSGSFYFTDSLNGNKIFPYQDEINEINNLVNSYDVLPDINNKSFDIVENQVLVENGGQIINYYSCDDSKVSINYNDVVIKDLTEGEYTFTLYRNDNNYNSPAIFYQSYDSQNLIKTGDLENKYASFKVNVYKTKIDVTKVDEDTEESIPQGEAELDGAIIKVLDIMKHIVGEIKIEDGKGYTENLCFGKYYLKEIDAGKGYNINEDLVEVTISVDNPTPTIKFPNKVIEKKLTIKKEFGENDNFSPEKNIDFEIYDKDNNLVKTVSTDDNGEIKTTLPYGTYTIIQKNSTNGYQKINPFNIIVDKDDEETIELKDYKIPVPNTSCKKLSILFIISLLLLL